MVSIECIITLRQVPRPKMGVPSPADRLSCHSYIIQAMLTAYQVKRKSEPLMAPVPHRLMRTLPRGGLVTLPVYAPGTRARCVASMHSMRVPVAVCLACVFGVPDRIPALALSCFYPRTHTTSFARFASLQQHSRMSEAIVIEDFTRRLGAPRTRLLSRRLHFSFTPITRASRSLLNEGPLPSEQEESWLFPTRRLRGPLGRSSLIRSDMSRRLKTDKSRQSRFNVSSTLFELCHKHGSLSVGNLWTI